VNKTQRLFREQDRRARRVLVAALAGSALLAGGALAVVGARVQQVHLAYRLDALRGQRDRAEANVRQLEIEVTTLKAPARLESRARQLGMTPPGRDQVRLAREYVAASTGLAAIRSRAASLSGVPPTDIGSPSLRQRPTLQQ
jgi:cell division protein FtsL